MTVVATILCGRQPHQLERIPTIESDFAVEDARSGPEQGSPDFGRSSQGVSKGGASACRNVLVAKEKWHDRKTHTETS